MVSPKSTRQMPRPGTVTVSGTVSAVSVPFETVSTKVTSVSFMGGVMAPSSAMTEVLEEEEMATEKPSGTVGRVSVLSPFAGAVSSVISAATSEAVFSGVGSS